MRTLLDNDMEQVQQLLELTRSLADYHKRASDMLQSCLDELEDIATAAKTKPPLPRYKPYSTSILIYTVGDIRVGANTLMFDNLIQFPTVFVLKLPQKGI